MRSVVRHPGKCSIVGDGEIVGGGNGGGFVSGGERLLMLKYSPLKQSPLSR